MVATPAVSSALEYLKTQGDGVRPVTNRRHLLKGWRWYSPASQQMLTDADLVEYAKNVREF